MLNQKKILCSACLLGVKCRYDGQSRPNEKVLKLAKKEILIPVCPERLGGLPTPRVPAQMVDGDGEGVLLGRIKVLRESGEDVSDFFIKGAQEALKLAKILDIKEAILKQRSPSCGSGQIYNGSFSKTVVRGDGVTTALLKQNGIKVISEEDL